MSRAARKRSTLGIYYIIVRGPRGQRIFGTDQFKQQYLDTVQKLHAEESVRVYAYTVLDNEAHLLIEEQDDTVSDFMRRVGISYVHWYNRLENRVGALFRDRYTSYPIEAENDCMKMIRFIHQLPVYRGATARMDLYPFSSYREYLAARGSRRVDSGEWLGRLGDWNYETYMSHSWKQLHVAEAPSLYHLQAEEAEKLIRERLQGRDPQELATMDRDERNRLIAEWRYLDHLSIAQICRLTPLGKGIVQRVGCPPDLRKQIREREERL